VAISGMAGLLKSMGVDTEELTATANQFMEGMKAQAQTINANQTRIETKLDAILELLNTSAPAPATRELLENGERTGVLITDEKFPQAMLDDANGGARHERDSSH
jgi:hypothetical protein